MQFNSLKRGGVIHVEQKIPVMYNLMYFQVYSSQLKFEIRVIPKPHLIISKNSVFRNKQHVLFIIPERYKRMNQECGQQ